jgi:hypothetical protein
MPHFGLGARAASTGSEYYAGSEKSCEGMFGITFAQMPCSCASRIGACESVDVVAKPNDVEIGTPKSQICQRIENCDTERNDNSDR